MTHPDPARLAAIPLFAGLSAEQLDTVASWMDVEEFDTHSHPTNDETHGYVFFVLDEGRAHAEHDGRVLEVFEPGSVFGEMAFFEPTSRRSATIVPETPIRVFSMFGTQFRQMQMQMPAVADRLRQLYEERHSRSRRMDSEA